MSDKKISQLTAGGAAQAGDEIPIARSGTNVKVTGADIAAAATSVGTLTGLTVNGNATVTGASFGLSGNISAPAWTTNGIRYKNASATLTDTSSSGTVATAYTNLYGGNTIAASNATTFTDYLTTFIDSPVAGTNVTLTNRWALGLGGALRMTGQSLTGSQAQSLIDAVATWNTTGTPTALKLNVTDTASNANSLLMDLQTGGVSRFKVAKDGTATAANIALPTNGTVGNSSNNAQIRFLAHLTKMTYSSGVHEFTNSSGGIYFYLDANNASFSLGPVVGSANLFEQRSTTNAQTFRVYNTYTDASNYERAYMAWGSNRFVIGVEAAGSGTTRSLQLVAGGGNTFLAHFSGGTGLAYNTPTSVPTFLIAANTSAGAYNVSLNGLGVLSLTTAGSVKFGDSSIARNADGVLALYDGAGTSFGRLQFGGTTSSFPALKRNSTALETKLADDSAYAPHAMQYLDVTDGVTAPASAAGRARIYVDTADGDLKVIFADGTVKTIVVDS